MPGDRNRDNIYEVTVRASDGVMYADRMVTVKVTDADEVGKVELSSQDALIEVELTTTLTDSDGGVPTPGRFTDVKWQWHRLDMAADAPDVSDDDTNNAIEDETSASYTPTADDRGKYLKVTATYTDRTRDEDNMDEQQCRRLRPIHEHGDVGCDDCGAEQPGQPGAEVQGGGEHLPGGGGEHDGADGYR